MMKPKSAKFSAKKSYSGIKSGEGDNFFPKGAKEHSFKSVGDIPQDDYPDSADDISSDQMSQVNKAKKSARKNLRK